MPSRAARLLQLLERLRAHRQPVPGAALAAELGISLRTLYRDVSTLREQARASTATRASATCCAPASRCRR